MFVSGNKKSEQANYSTDLEKLKMILTQEKAMFVLSCCFRRLTAMRFRGPEIQTNKSIRTNSKDKNFWKFILVWLPMVMTDFERTVPKATKLLPDERVISLLGRR